ncbi:MAG: GLUG motif-containing protein, partial [Candidatus Cloacimonetes bacterium]|nr:GLUG motif-containing protein [Candidatus Cloacimonadota bacterium]
MGYNVGTVTRSYYNNEANTATTMVDKANLGKTKSEIISLAKANWSDTFWGTSGDTIEGYTTDIIALPVLKTFFKPTATLFNSGYGTSANPYTITNWTQLQNINYASDHTLLSKYYTLSNNINSATAGYTALASATANGGAGFVPIGTQANQFKGTFDGLGHTIADLYINRPTMDLVGLFGLTNGATIRNIGIVNANITGQNGTGGLAGNTYVTTITNAYATGSVTGKGMVGGLVGMTNSSSTITSSYATANVIGSGNQVGGLLGAAYTTSSITNSYATGSVEGVGMVGGLVGELLQSSPITNSYATGLVTGATSAGGLVGAFSGGGAVTNSYWDTQTSGQPNSARGAGKTTEEMMKSSTYTGWLTTIWSFVDGSTVAGYVLGGLPYLKNVTRTQDIVTSSETLFAGGFGTTANPYTITNWTQLQNINNNNILTHNYYFNLSNDIGSSTAGYTNSGEGWLPIGTPSSKFLGSFDGLGHTIDALTINRPDTSYVGLFGCTRSGSTIQNLGLTHVAITGERYVGGLVGENDGAITNAYVSGSVSGKSYVGGLTGDNYGTITNAYVTNADISGIGSESADIGGLVGVNHETITNSFYNIDATTINGAAGVVTQRGIYGTQFAKWLNQGKTLTIELPLSTGYYTLSTMQNLKDMLAFIYEGGYNFRLVQDIALSAGWYIPVLSGTFDGDGHVLSGLNTQQAYNSNLGFVGILSSSGAIQNLGLTNVTISGNRSVGGLVGINYGSITNAYVSGSVTGKDSHEGYIGGLVGLNKGTISHAYASGSVSGIVGVGGLVGVNLGAIFDVYATNSVTGHIAVGGLAGGNEGGTITNAYASGFVSGDNYIGGLVGYKASGTISSSFWNTQTSGQATVGIGLDLDNATSDVSGKTTTQLQQLSTFRDAGWDIAVGTSATPSLSMGGTHIWMIAPETVNYTLSDITNTYKGDAYTLSDLWSASTLFGASHSSWVFGTDYNFLDNSGNVVTSYTNAGTYSNLHIDILRNGY